MYKFCLHAQYDRRHVIYRYSCFRAFFSSLNWNSDECLRVCDFKTLLAFSRRLFKFSSDIKTRSRNEVEFKEQEKPLNLIRSNSNYQITPSKIWKTFAVNLNQFTFQVFKKKTPKWIRINQSPRGTLQQLLRRLNQLQLGRDYTVNLEFLQRYCVA